MSIINRGLGFTKTLIMRGLGGSFETDDSNNLVRSKSIIIESNIKPKHFFYPLTGIYSENKNVKGWKYSKSITQDLDDITLRINNSIGGYDYNLEEGSIRTDWKGATVEGIKLDNIVKKYKRNYSSEWIPKVTTGFYSIYWLEKALYSDESSSLLLEKELVENQEEDDDGNIITFLEVFPFVNLPYGSSNINITVFKRDKYFVNIPWLRYEFVEENNGIDLYTFEAEDILETETSSEKTQLKINSFFEKQVGILEDFNYEENKDIIESFEFAGIGSPYRSIIYSEYFPIQNVRLIEEYIDIEGNTSIEEWVEVEEFSFENKKEFIVDKFKGRLLINKTETISYLADSFNSENKELVFFDSLEPWQLQKGVVEIEGERCEYYEKGYNTLLLKETPTFISDGGEIRGKEVTFLKEGHNFENLSNLWIGYKCLPRIDFELEANLRTSNVDVKPYKKIDSNGILEINPYERHISKIVVESDLNLNNGIYESLFMGGDSTRITATVYNTHGTPVKEIPVTFYTDLGKFNSENETANSITNQNGEAYTYYSWPYSQENDHILIERIEYEGEDTVIEISGHSVGYNAAEANIFQVAKDDPFYGSLGWETKISRVDEDEDYIYITIENNLPNLEEYFSNQMLYEEYQTLSTATDFENFISEHNCQDLLINYSLAFIKHSQEFRGLVKIIIDKIIDKKSFAVKKDFFSDRNFLINIIGSSISLYKRNELVFDQENVRNGFSYDRVMYYDNGDKLVPIKPVSERLPNNNIIIKYQNIHLPEPNMQSSDTLIAAYKIFLDRVSRIRAEAIDPATGRTVVSNTIKILVSLPNYLKGNNGFKIVSEENDEESGLGGSNFITVNEIEAINDYNELVTISPFHRNIINFFINNEA